MSTTIHEAASRGDVVLLSKLVRSHRGDGLSVRCAFTGLLPLHFAAQAGSVRCVRWLLEAGADPCAAALPCGTTPLHMACRHGRTKCARLLLAAGADERARDRERATPLHVAIASGREGAVSELLAQCGDGYVAVLGEPGSWPEMSARVAEICEAAHRALKDREFFERAERMRRDLGMRPS